MNRMPASFTKPQRLQPTITVLLIDDAEADWVTYTRYLQSDPNYQYAILNVDTLQAGMVLWQSQSPDVVLLDVNLPDGDGFKFLEFLQVNWAKGEFHAKVPVIVLTGQGNERVAVRAMKLGAMDYLNKADITASSLRKSVLAVIEYQALARQLTRSQQQKEWLSEIALRIRQSLDLSQILQSAVDGLRQLLACDRAIIYQFQADWSGWVVVESVCTDELSILNRTIADPCLASQWHEPYRQGRISTVNDREDGSLQSCYAELLSSLQVRANLVVPILQDELLWGLLIAHECYSPRCWESSDIHWVQQLATQVSIAIQQATAYTQLQIELRERQQAEAQLQQLNQELEDRVAQRTVALQQSEARLQEAQEIACLGDWELDISTTKITWSPAIFRIFGFDPNQPEPTYEESLLLFTEPDRHRIEAAVQQAIETGNPYELDIPFTRVDGSSGYIFVRGRPIRNEQGDVVRMVGILMDISDRKQAEAELVHHTKEVEDLYNKAPCGYHSLDFQGRYIRVNETELQWLGYTREEMIDQPFIQFLTAASRQTFFENYEHFCQRGWVKDLEFDMVRKDGSILPILLNATAVIDEEGNYLHSRSTLLDMRDRKATESALQESETKFRRMAENVPGMIYRYVLHPDGTDEFSYVSPYVWEIYELRPEVMVKDARSLWSRIHPDDVSLIETQTTVSAETLQPFLLEHRLITPQAGLKWVQITSRPERQENGDVVWDGVVQDITAHKAAEAQLQQTNLELARATRLKDEFLANMSHELRTPLHSILGMSDVLQVEVWGPLNEQQKQAIATIESSGRHLLELINDILDLAKISSGRMELTLAPTSVQELCDSSLLLVQQQALEKGLQVTSEIATDLGDIMIDERRIRQVLINLLTNAVKFTPDGGQITLEVKRPTKAQRQELGTGTWVLFSVMDTGIGISSDDLSRLFQPFVQIDSRLNRQQPGTGLGLAMAKQIAAMHSGWITVNSCLGQGSCFTLALPYQQPSIAQPPFHASQAGASPISKLGRSETAADPLILLAEDNEANIVTFTAYLNSCNYRMIVARNGEEAVALAKAEQPDLILMDIQMPMLDGLEAIRLIRVDPQLVAVPIIALTALAMPEDQERCIAAGANHYLSKPVELKQLVEAIQQWV